VLLGIAMLPFAVTPAGAAAAGIDWVRIGSGPAAFEIARTETTVGQFRRFVQATGTVTAAERAGGGEVYEAGWVRKPGWTWAAPFGAGGRPADDEPAVHVTFGEAQAFCRWAGGRLPRDAEWTAAAFEERRAVPPPPFERGVRYPFPTGTSPTGAQCLDDCGPAARGRAIAHGAALLRGHGHARAGSTPAGVNGLHEMGGNAWEWVDEPPSAPGDRPDAQRLTRGGSWWYGAGPMRAEHRQSKPADTTVVYIGFRCVREVPAAR
jgi:formylglycine-generating enzyme required for sulfatase activity